MVSDLKSSFENFRLANLQRKSDLSHRVVRRDMSLLYRTEFARSVLSYCGELFILHSICEVPNLKRDTEAILSRTARIAAQVQLEGEKTLNRKEAV